jgi:hypothetical protein
MAILEKTLDPKLCNLVLPDGVIVKFGTGTDTSKEPHSATGSYPTKVLEIYIEDPKSNTVILSIEDITTIQKRIIQIERTWSR